MSALPAAAVPRWRDSLEQEYAPLVETLERLIPCMGDGDGGGAGAHGRGPGRGLG
ncbi:hypothetical protein [Luteimonas sp. A501]